MLISNKVHVTVPVSVITKKIETLAKGHTGYMKSYFILLLIGLETNTEGVVNPLALFLAMHLATDSLASESRRKVAEQIPSLLELLRDEVTEELISESQKVSIACTSLLNTRKMKGQHYAPHKTH